MVLEGQINNTTINQRAGGRGSTVPESDVVDSELDSHWDVSRINRKLS